MLMKNESKISKFSIVQRIFLERTMRSSIIKFKEIVYIGRRRVEIGYRLFIGSWLSVQFIL